MSDKPFVVNDRRKFTAEGELRPDVHIEESSEPQETAAAPESHGGPQLVTEPPASTDSAEADAAAAFSQGDGSDNMQEPPPLTEEQIQGAARAYDATSERLETAMRAADPGGERMPPMSFGSLVQSLYMQTMLQLGAGTEQGQQPRVDLLGARQTIDLMAVVADKTSGNLTGEEKKLLDAALFEMRMGFLDVTQALARQASAGGPGMPPPPGGNGPQRVV